VQSIGLLLILTSHFVFTWSLSHGLSLLIGIIIALVIVVPSFWLLFYVFKLKKVTDRVR
jgi:hypothetical protein